MLAYVSAEPEAQGVLQVTLVDSNARDLHTTCITHPAVAARRAKAGGGGKKGTVRTGCAGHSLHSMCGVE
jgi:hypothetical protein